MKTVKLTPKQNMVINCMQNGWVLICSPETSYITCAGDKLQFEFNASILFRLINLGLIWQELGSFDFVLTKAGKEIKTKEIDFLKNNQK